MSQENFTSQEKTKKGMKKSAKVTLLLLSILFFIAAVVTPIVIFAMPKTKVEPDKTLGNFVLRYDAAAKRYDIVRYIGDDVDVVIPSQIDGIKIRAILPNAFDASKRHYSANIKSVVIGEGVSSIGANAFKDCDGITSMTMPQSMRQIGKEAFIGSGLESLIVKDASVLSFTAGALDGAENLSTLEILGASDKLEVGNLDNISGITNVVLGGGVEISSGAFASASSITSLTVYNYDNLVVDSSAFHNSNITTLNVRKINENLTRDFMLKFQGLNRLKEINIEREITSVDAEALSMFGSLEKVTAYSGTEIDVTALPISSGVYNVKVELAEDDQGDIVLNIGNKNNISDLTQSFLACFEYDKITKVILSENFTSIGNDAFLAYNQINSVDFGANSKITTLGNRAFNTARMPSVDVTGPVDKNNAIFAQFNKAIGTYKNRHTYNGLTEMGSYYVNLNYGLGKPGGPTEDNLVDKTGPYFNDKRVEVVIGESILNSLPHDTIYYNEADGSIDKTSSIFVALGYKVSWFFDEEFKNQVTEETMAKEYDGKTFYAFWIPDDDSRYQVEHYIQNLDEANNTGADEYTLYRTEVKVGKTGTEVSADLLSITGFSRENTSHTNRLKTSLIRGDGKTVLRVYYLRDVYQISFDLNDGDPSAEYPFTKATLVTENIGGENTITVVYGGKYGTLPTASRPGYSFDGWYTSLSSGSAITSESAYPLSEESTLIAKYTANKSDFKVEVYRENAEDDEYTLYGLTIALPGGGQMTTDTIITYVPNAEAGEGVYKAIAPTFEGFEFDPTNANSNLTARVNGDGKTTFRLYYNRIRYNISYNLNDSTKGNGSTEARVLSGDIGSRQGKFGAKYINGFLPVVERDGYIFKGWCSSINGDADKFVGVYNGSTFDNNEITIPAGIIGEDNTQILYAIWENKTYTVNYDKNDNDATGEMTPSTHTFDQASNLTACGFTKTGYSFEKWSYTLNSETLYLADEAEITTLITNGEITLHAVWKANKYTITFDAKGGNVTPASKEVTYDSTYGELPTPTFKGYTFEGWYFNEDLSGEKVTAETTVKVANNDTLYAKYDTNRYSITYHANHGTVEPVPVTGLSCVEGVTLSTEIEAFKRPGYTFTGWSQNQETKQYNAGEVLSEAFTSIDGANIDLYAIWQANKYNVRIYRNFDKADANYTDVVVTYSDTVRPTNPYTKPGYSFNGYSKTREGAKIPSFAELLANTNVSERVDVYVLWLPGAVNVRVEYYLQDFEASNDYALVYNPSATGFYQTEKSAGSPVTIELEEFYSNVDEKLFVGFKFDAEATGNLNHTDSVNGDGTTVLKLYFSRVKTIINFEENPADGTNGTISGAHDSITVIYGLPYTRVWNETANSVSYKAMPVLTRQNYIFRGWSTSANGAVIGDSENAMFTKGTPVTLYAIWEADDMTYTVEHIFENANGEGFESTAHESETVTIKADEYVTVEPNTYSGLTFKQEGSNNVNVQIKAGETTVIKLYYTRNLITITAEVRSQDGNDTIITTKTEQKKYGAVLNLREVFGTHDIDGYTFKSWANAAGEEIETITVGLNEETIHATFTENEYTVTVQPGEGGSLVSARARTFARNVVFEGGQFVIKYTEQYDLNNLVSRVKKTGYTLTGFECGTKVFNLETEGVVSGEALAKAAGLEKPYKNASITLTAQYTENSYTITYVNGTDTKDGGSHLYTASFNLEGDELFSRNGYHYTEWKVVGTEEKFAVGSAFSFASNRAENYELTPDWIADTFEIVYNKNATDATGTINHTPVTFDQEVTLWTDTFARTGYSFVEWNTKADRSGKGYAAGATISASDVNTVLYTKGQNTVTLYTIWKANEFTIIYDANKPTGASGTISGTMANSIFTYGASTNVLRPNAYTLAGHTFKGWATSKNGNVVYNNNDDTLNLLYNDGNGVTLYAVWEANKITVRYNKTSGATGGATMGSSEFTYDIANILKENTYVLDGYNFLGWALTENATEALFTDHESVANRLFEYADSEGNVDLYTVWGTRNDTEYKVEHYKQNTDGDYILEITDTKYGVTDQTATATYKTFAGYHTNLDKDTDLSGTIAGDGSLVLKVYYDRNTYNVVYDKNVDESKLTGPITFMPESTSIIYKDKYTSSMLTNGARTGYTFAGWFLDKGLTTAVTTDTVCEFTGDNNSTITLYASWTARADVKYTVTYYYQGLDGEYNEDPVRVNKTGTADATINVSADGAKSGFTAPAKSTVSLTVRADGTSNVDFHYTRNQYTVTLVKGTGTKTFTATGEGVLETLANGYKVYFGTSLTLSATALDGYSFVNFTIVSDTETASEATILVNGDVTVKANFKANEYTVKFNVPTLEHSTVTGDYADRVVTFNTFIGNTAPSVEAVGYTFEGWFTAAEGGEAVDFTVNLDSNPVDKETTIVKVYAHFTANKVTVNFNANGGTASETSKELTFAENYVLATATRTGYTFGGWYKEEAFANKVETTTPVTTASNHTLYAKWTANSYTVTYEPNGGTVDPTSKVVTFNSDYGDLPSATTTTKTGYTFAGWYLNADFSGDAVTATTPVTTADDHTLYAKWTAITYKVSFDARGGDPTPADRDVTFDKAYGTLPSVAKTGYTFDGWFTAAEAGTEVTATTVLQTASNHTLYAHWTANQYTVKFNVPTLAYSEVTGDHADRVVTFDTFIGDTAPSVAAVGYHFDGWFTEATGGSEVNFNTNLHSNPVNATTTIVNVYAHFTANKVTVNFNANGGTASETSKELTFAENYVLATATRTGYTFTGWHMGAEDGELVTTATKVSNAATHTLVASWRKNTYKIIFDVNTPAYSTVVGSIADITATFDEETNISKINTITAEGYEKVDGWFTEATGGSEVDFTSNLVAAPAEDGSSTVTVYAHWTARTFTVTYNVEANGGSFKEGVSNTKTVTFGKPYGDLLNETQVTAENAQLIGWFTAATDGTEITSGAIVTTAEDHTLYAQFGTQRVDYTIIYKTQDLGADTYTEHSQETKKAQSGSTITVTPIAIPGFDTPASQSVLIEGKQQGDNFVGTTVVTFEYVRHTYLVKVSSTVGGTATIGEGLTELNVQFGGTATLTAVEADGYTFAGWYVRTNARTDTLLENGTTLSYSLTMPALSENGAEYNIIAKFTANTNTAYTVKHYEQNVDGTYPDAATTTDNLTGTTDTLATATVKTITGFSLDSEKSTLSGNIAGDGSLVLKVYYKRNVYTVTLNATANGGALASGAASTLTVTFGGTYGTMPDATRNGYGFNGWFTAKSGGTKVEGTTVVTTSASGQTLYAQFTALTYQIKFDVNKPEHTTTETIIAPTPITAIFDAIIGTLETVSCVGYSFDGWYTLAEGGDKVIETDKNLIATLSDNDQSITLYAHWVVRTYNVKFNVNKPTYSTVTPGAVATIEGVEFGAEIGALTDLHAYGYTFDGWFTALTGGTKVEATSTNLVSDPKADGSSEVTLYAHWTQRTYQVTFNVNKPALSDVTPAAVEAKTVKYGEAIGTLTELSATGYSFTYWTFDGTAVNANTTSSLLCPELDDNTTSVELVAAWTIDTYSLTVSATEGGSATVNTAPNGAAGKYNYKTSVTVTATTNNGYYFVGWFTSADETVAVSTDKSYTFNITGDTTLVAKFEQITYTLNAIVNTYKDYANSTLSANVNAGGTVTIAKASTRVISGLHAGDNVKLTVTENNGYHYIATYRNANAVALTNWNYTIPTEAAVDNAATATIELIVVFEENLYQVTYNVNGGTLRDGVSSAVNNLRYSDSITTLAVSDITLTGHTLANFKVGGHTINLDTEYTLAELADKAGSAANSSTRQVIELVAQFTANKYTITFNGGTAEHSTVERVPAAIEVTYGMAISGTALSEPTASGYTFAGWYNGDTKYTNETVFTKTSDITLTAHWNINSYTLTVKAEGPGKVELEVNGSAVAESEATMPYYSAYKITATTTTPGYHFAGWYKTSLDHEITFGVTGNVLTGNMTAEDFTVIALFKEDLYVVEVSTNVTGTSASITTTPTEDGKFELGTKITVTATGKDGYRFDGWYHNGSKIAGAGEEYEFTLTAQASNGATYSLQARFVANEYTIRFNANGANVTLSETSRDVIFDNLPIAALKTPTRAGYDFAGWFTAAEGGIEITSEKLNSNLTDKPADNGSTVVDLYAHWTARTDTRYKIEIYQQKVDRTYPTAPSIENFDEGTTDSTVNAPANTYEGFTKVTHEGEILSGKVDAVTMLVLKVYYERDTYTVSFNANGGTITGANSITVVYEDKYTGMPKAAKAGHNFDGWFTALTGGTEITATTTVPLMTKGETQTLYAHYTAHTYNVKVEVLTFANDTLLAGEVGGSVTTASTVTFGGSLTFTVNIANGFHYIGIYKTKGADNTLSGAITLTDWNYTVPAEAEDGATLTFYARFDKNTYNLAVTAGANGSANGSQTGVLDGTEVTVTATANTGYSFEGWYNAGTKITGANATYSFTLDYNLFTIPEGGDINDINGQSYSLEARFVINKYTVTVNQQTYINGTLQTGDNAKVGGSVAGSGTFDYKTEVTVTATANTGYSFEGWYENNAKITDATASYKFTLGAASKTLTARFVANKYTVTFNTNVAGDDLDQPESSLPSIDVYFDTAYGTLASVTRNGYDFNGWYTAVKGGTKIEPSTVVTTASNHTLYAHYTIKSYNFTLNGNGADKISGYNQNWTVADGAATITVPYRSDLTALDLPSFTKNGYHFLGWYDSTAENANKVTLDTFEWAGNKTLFAKWEANKYTVAFNVNATADDKPTAPANGEVTYGQTYKNLPTLTWTGWQFDGWFTAATDGTKIIPDGEENATVCQNVLENGATINLYAHWTRMAFTVTYDLNANGDSSATVTPANKEVIYGGTYGTLPNATNTTRTGYTFVGWFTAKTDGDEVTASTTVTTAANHTIYAHWTANTYIVSFNPNYVPVIGSERTTEVTFDSPYGELPVTTRDGYTFAGWYTAAEGGTKVEETTIVKTASDHTLYAHWTIHKYAVIVETEGAEGAAAGITNSSSSGGFLGDLSYSYVSGVPYNSSVTVITTGVNGYHFVGWFSSIGGTTAVATTAEYTFTMPALANNGDTLTLTARYEINKFNVEIYMPYKDAADAITLDNTLLNGGLAGSVAGNNTVLTVSNVDFNTNILAGRTVIANAGYTFVGWYYCDVTAGEVTALGSAITLTNGEMYLPQATGHGDTVQIAAYFEQSKCEVQLSYNYFDATNATTLNTVATVPGGSNPEIATVSFENVMTENGKKYIYYGQTPVISSTIGSAYEYKYEFLTYLVNGVQASTISPLQPSSGAVTTYVVQFTTKQYSITANAMVKRPNGIHSLGDVQAATDVYGKVVNNGPFYVGQTITTSNISYVAGTNYHFVGWYTDEECGVAIAFGDLAYNTPENHTIYALFEPDEYTLTVNPDGGTYSSTGVWTQGTGALTLVVYYDYVGTVEIPMATKAGFYLKGYKYGSADNEVVARSDDNKFIYTLEETARTFEAQWQQYRYVTIYDYFRTPYAMHQGNTGMNITGANSAFTGNAASWNYGDPTGATVITSVPASEATSRHSGYTFVGYYASIDGMKVDVTSLSAEDYALTATGDITLYALYKPNAIQVTVNNYTLTGTQTEAATTAATTKGQYTLSTLGGTPVLKIGGANVTLSTNTAGIYTVTTYYGGSYSLTGTATTNYELIGFINNSSSVSAWNVTPTHTGTYTFTSNAASTVLVMFRGKQITVTYTNGGQTGVTMPNATTTFYGLTVTKSLGFNAYAVDYKENTGFRTSNSSATFTRATANWTSSNGKISYEVSANLNITTSNTAELVAVWGVPELWVETTLALDSFKRGYSGDGSQDALYYAATAINGNSSFSTDAHYPTHVTVLKTVTLKSTTTISKPLSIDSLDSNNKQIINGTMNITYNAEVGYYNLKFSGNMGFVVGSGKTLIIKESEFTNVVANAGTSKSLFEVSGGTLNVANCSFTGVTTGVSGGFGGIINAQNGATVEVTNATFNGNISKGKNMIYINASTATFTGCNVGTDAANTVASGNTSFEALFYNVNGTLTLTSGTITTGGVRAITTEGTSGVTNSETTNITEA